MTGTFGSSGGGSGGGNPFQQATDPTQAFGGSFWGNTGDPSNPAVTAAQPAASAQSQAAAAPPPPPPPTPTPTTSSLHDDISNILFGGGQQATEPVKYAASAGTGLSGGGSEFPQPPAPLTAQAPTATPAWPGTAAAATPPGGAIANTMTGLPAAASGGIGAPRAISPSEATISPQSATTSGNTGDTSTSDAGGGGDTSKTPSIPKKVGGALSTFASGLRSGAGSPETSPTPDIAGSAREAGAGPGGAGAVENPAFSTPEGGGPPQVLQDLLSGNFGRFIGDLLGQQGLPQGQNYAGTPRPGPGMAAVPPEAAGVAPPGLPTSAPGAAGGYGGGQSPMPSSPTQVASAAGAIGDPLGYQGGTGGQPTQMAPPGEATAATPPGGSGGLSRHEGAPTPGAPMPASTTPPPAGVTDYTQQARQAGLRTHGMMNKVQGMVVHHTGGGNNVQDIINTLRQRNLGVHFVIDRDGKTYQLAPDGQVMYHTKNGGTGTIGRRGLGYGNGNLEGVEIIAKNDRDVNPAQRQAAANLIQQRSQKYGWDPQRGLFGHGQLNRDKERDEGMSVVNGIHNGTLRANTQGATASLTPTSARPVDPVAAAMQAQARPPGPFRQTRGDRNRNPGNIKMGPDAQQYGATGVDNQGHAIFPTTEAGIQAQASLLKRRYNNKTVQEIGRDYAEDRTWANGVLRASGFGRNERLNLNDPNTLRRLQRAIWRQEGTHPQEAEGDAILPSSEAPPKYDPRLGRAGVVHG